MGEEKQSKSTKMNIKDRNMDLNETLFFTMQNWPLERPSPNEEAGSTVKYNAKAMSRAECIAKHNTKVTDLKKHLHK